MDKSKLIEASNDVAERLCVEAFKCKLDDKYIVQYQPKNDRSLVYHMLPSLSTRLEGVDNGFVSVWTVVNGYELVDGKYVLRYCTLCNEIIDQKNKKRKMEKMYNIFNGAVKEVPAKTPANWSPFNVNSEYGKMVMAQ